MSWEYSENILIQKSAGKVLKNKLGWDVVFAYDQEKLGENGTLGRKSYKEIVLTRYLRKALFQNNDWMTEAYCDSAIKILCSYTSSATLMQINEEKYNMLRDGIPVSYKKSNGTYETRYAKVFDFDEPENNCFLAVKEMKIHGANYRRRTDIVGFVNGIPLLFIELKNHNVDVSDAYYCNYTDYLDTIPQLFRFNAFLMLSNGLEAKVGTMGSKYEFFHEWKRLKEDKAGAVDLETMLLGICNKKNFMDLFENFILFDHSGGKTAKIFARNHQYLGVNEAVESYKTRKLKEGKLGVFWHTQGSGKSYSMVFLAQKIRRKFAGSPTFVILTDREELNKQISNTFEACGCLSNKSSKYIPSSGKQLIDMLGSNPSYIFTLIQKFNDNQATPITPDYDIVILSDEAHRTQNGIFSDNMCRLLPNASRIGFTGTPLFKYDNITKRTFGDYVSIYDFKRAVDDGATVPLYYENRSDMLEIKNPEINEELLNAVEEADLDINQRTKLELELRKDYHILTSQPRLDDVAKDFVNHYSELWTTGKAMFVCINKVTCVRMYNLAQKYWAIKITELEKELKNATQQEAQELQRKIDWMKETEMAVIVSQEQNEIQTFNNWGLDIKFHREKMENREMDKEFKDSDNPFRIVFVCAMWLTGFDVKSLATIYLDKPLKAHTLMQTIARANRVCDGKSNGLIVDYIGVVTALRKALADYTAGKNEEHGETPAPDKEELIIKIKNTIKSIEMYMSEQGFLLKNLVNATDFQKLALVAEGANAMTVTDEIKKRFEIQARELFRMFKYVEKNEVSESTHQYKNAINAIYEQMQVRRRHADNSALMAQINGIISEHIYVNNNTGLAESKKFDISNIDFDRLRKEFEKAKNKNSLFRDLQQTVEERLAKMLKSNPLRIDYYERYQEIVDEYNRDNKKDEIAIIFETLMNLVNDLDEEQKRYVREGFNNDEELTMFDLLIQEKTLSKEEIKKVKKLAQNMLVKIKEKIHQLDRWRDKEETQSIISVLIRDLLWQDLPESYDDKSISDYRQRIYEYVYETYPAA
ncbi:MAG: type I restriction endonuclease subunit R [Acutalibacteraceae bacterium]|nr:type I restriction endonuclease subunit R [Acutalibacteraceae bacterium]